MAGAGVSLSALIREAAALNLGGIECLVGVPATVGGAVAMNAGTPDGGIADFISAVYFLHPDGTLGEFKPGAGSFSYRMFAAAAGLGADRGAAAASPAALRGDPEGHQAAAEAEEGDPAAGARLGGLRVEEPAGRDRHAGSSRRWACKGKRLNGAEISAKHANFIVNRGGRRGGRHQGPHAAHPRPGAQPLRHHARAGDQDHGRDLRTHSAVISPRVGPRPARGLGRARPRDGAPARLAARASPGGSPAGCAGSPRTPCPSGWCSRRCCAAGLGALWALTSPRFRSPRLPSPGRAGSVPEDIVAASGIGPGTNLFRLDRDAVVARLEALPLVRRAELVRRFPNQVTLAVEERRPFTLVHAGRLHWIDEQGVNLGPGDVARSRRGLPSSPVSGRPTWPPTAGRPRAWRRGIALLPAPAALGDRAAPADLRDRREPARRAGALHGGRRRGAARAPTTGKAGSAGCRACWPSCASGGEAVGAIDLRFRDQVVLKTVTR